MYIFKWCIALRRYDAFASQKWCCSTLFRNDAMFAPKCGEATHHLAKPSSLAEPTSFAEGKHHSKNAPLSVDKSAFFVGGERGIRTLVCLRTNWFRVRSVTWKLSNNTIPNSPYFSSWSTTIKIVRCVEFSLWILERRSNTMALLYHKNARKSRGFEKIIPLLI